jgi:hypothetical protein
MNIMTTLMATIWLTDNKKAFRENPTAQAMYHELEKEKKVNKETEKQLELELKVGQGFGWSPPPPPQRIFNLRNYFFLYRK